MKRKYYTPEHASLIASSGFFDADFYCAKNPDIMEQDLDPLTHFIGLGGFEGRDPNAYFSISKYLEVHPEVLGSGLNPLTHFLLYGSGDARAFVNFDATWYYRTYPECCENGMHPLGHYLTRGRQKGYIRNEGDALGHVQECELRVILSAPAASEIVLFVTHAPNGRIKPHALHYINSFKTAGICVIIIVAADNPIEVEEEKLIPFCDGLILRQNGGYDFAAWAHALNYVDISNASTLFFANDSVIGPLDNRLFLSIINRVRESEAELVGITDNQAITYHFQSFLFATKGVGVCQMANFLSKVMLLSDKQKVITTYETRFFDYLHRRGIKSEVLFPCGNVSATRSTIYWRELVSQGFPFIKVEVFRIVSRLIWEKTLREYRFPIEYVDQTLEITECVSSGTSRRSSRRARVTQMLSFGKYFFYRAMEAFTRPFSAKRSMEYALRAYKRKVHYINI